jgi:lipid A ethanolaminephosphotransferase
MQGGSEPLAAAKPRPSRVRRWRSAAWVLALLVFVIATNSGFLERVDVVVEQGRLGTLAGFAGLWALAAVSLLVVALQPNRWVRAAWALVISAAAAVGFAFRRASGSDLTLMDVISLWSARHEAARAMDFYTAELLLLVVVFAIGFVLLAAAPAATGGAARRWLRRLAWLPIVPVAATAAIVAYKDGGGSQALPVQFTPLSLAAVSGAALAGAPIPERSPVLWQPQAAPVRRIVVLVDESIRSDYIDLTTGNPHTPELARLRHRLIDHGPAASGGVCSHYSNAILRFMAARQGLGRQLLANPTIWAYARKAGFRTVFIDAQAAFNRGPGKLQNFMTADEARDIDSFHALPQTVPAHALDDRLLDVVLDELRAPGPVLIYANKNGAHFPYDHGYPASEAVFRPRSAEAPPGDVNARVNSYRNVVRWTVDRLLKRLLDEADLKDTVVIYTSDHGQKFEAQRLSHCSVENPDPREALVPLFTITDNAAMRARLLAGAASNRGRGTHFLIAPTVLELLGYASADVKVAFGGGSLFERTDEAPAFTTGDIFNLFSGHVRLHPIDLERQYRENEPLAPDTLGVAAR